MLVADEMLGWSLPAGTLSLTFDDGPGRVPSGSAVGPQTVELAEYLADEGVPATFFVVGKHVERYPADAERLLALGHSLGNHTQTHRMLTSLPVDEAVADVAACAGLLASLGGGGGARALRTPYVKWSAEVCAALQAASLPETYVGPVGADFSGDDWLAWRERWPAEPVARRYLEPIEAAEHGGIVIMHDCSADPDGVGEQMQLGNRCLEVVRLVVPRLKALGFAFVPLESVPEVAALSGAA